MPDEAVLTSKMIRWCLVKTVYAP